MIDPSTITLLSSVTFDTYATAVLGTDYQNCEVMDILSWQTASMFSDVAQIHQSVYPLLPKSAGVPNDYRQYLYLKLKMASGQFKVIGLPWIVDSSWKVVQVQTLTVVVQAATADVQTNVLKALAAIPNIIGYSVVAGSSSSGGS